SSFMRTLVSGDSRYDRFQAGEESALNDAEKRGKELFFSERAECFHCHVGFNLTNNGFHNNGTRVDDPDLGRKLVTERESDRGKFKVPSLRNVAVTAPYMHDGSLATLEDVVEHYARGGQGHPNTEATIHPLELSAEDKADLVAFLRSLTDEAFLEDPRFQPEP
ncbi:MAG: c-type cytochrome, partial [Myxococcaceae bacterium]